MATLILGSGIIGTATAYYLSSHSSYNPKSHPIHLIETSHTPFLSASGLSGGFLARDWFSPGVSDLGELSFRLHQQLAEENDGRRRWGYAGSTAVSLSVEEEGLNGDGRKGVRRTDWLLEGTSRREVASGVGMENGETFLEGRPAWIAPQAGGTFEVISSEGGCAQVEPLMLCEFLMEKCKEKGVQLHLGSRAVGIVKGQEGNVTALKIENQGEVAEIESKNILIAAGAWTPRVFETLFPENELRIPIEPLAGYSIVVKSPRHNMVYAGESGDDYSVYCEPGKYWNFAPEAFGRRGKDGEAEIFVGGLNSSTLPLPESVTDIKKDEKATAYLRQVTVQLTGASKEGGDAHEDDLKVVREGLCFRPVATGGRPILCRVEDKKLGGPVLKGGGIFIAAGHGPWGISLSLGTGKVMSELIRGEETSARIDSLGMR